MNRPFRDKINIGFEKCEATEWSPSETHSATPSIINDRPFRDKIDNQVSCDDILEPTGEASANPVVSDRPFTRGRINISCDSHSKANKSWETHSHIMDARPFTKDIRQPGLQDGVDRKATKKAPSLPKQAIAHYNGFIEREISHVVPFQQSSTKSHYYSQPASNSAGSTGISIDRKGRKGLSAADIKKQILSKVRFIRHNNCLFAYTGRTYDIISCGNDLLDIVVNQVNGEFFGLMSTKVLDSVYNLLKVDNCLIPKDYEERLAASADMVVFRNTILNTRTLETVDFSPYYITTFEINADYIDNPYPSVFLDFLRTASGDDESVAARISDLIAIILSGTNHGKAFYVLGTAPDSGKSTLAKLCQEFLPSKYVHNVAAHELKDKFALGGSKGKIVNFSMDLPAGRLRSDVVSVIKNISGDDVILSQEKYEKKEFSKISMALVFGTNTPIQVGPDDDTTAFWSRLEVIPFNFSVSDSEKNVSLFNDLKKECNAIASYCINRLPDIIARGYKLTPCDVAELMKWEWRYGPPNSDTLESFCASSIEFTEDDKDYIPTTELYEMYTDYCTNLGIVSESPAVVKRWFTSQTGVTCGRYRRPKNSNPKMMFLGIKKRDFFEEED